MAALFALGVMSLPWMILISTFITVEKLLPTPRLGTVAVACVLAALTIGLLVAPAGIPGLTIPVHGSAPM